MRFDLFVSVANWKGQFFLLYFLPYAFAVDTSRLGLEGELLVFEWGTHLWNTLVNLQRYLPP